MNSTYPLKSSVSTDIFQADPLDLTLQFPYNIVLLQMNSDTVIISIRDHHYQLHTNMRELIII